MKIHPTLIVTKSRIPLGVIHSKIWTKDTEEQNNRKQKTQNEKDKERHTTPIKSKDSYRWIESMEASIELAKKFPEKEIINMGDRESDIYEMFLKSEESKIENIKYIIRNSQARSTTEKKKIKEILYSEDPCVEIKFTIKRNNKQESVHQEIRYKEVILNPPFAKKNLATIKLTSVLAKEKEGTSTREKKLEWMLLTNKKVRDASEAVEIVEYYLSRWEIETFFKVLKSGCKIESLRLEKKENLSKCICMYMAIACRIMYLLKLGRAFPDIEGANIFSEIELKCLYAKVGKKYKGEETPNLGEVIKLIAKLGGYMNRKKDGPPGPKTMWIGMQRLHYMVEGYNLSK